jgi:tight adherence protein C
MSAFYELLPYIAGFGFGGALFLLVTRLGGLMASETNRRMLKTLPKYTQNPNEVKISTTSNKKTNSLFFKLGWRLMSPKYRARMTARLQGSGKYGEAALENLAYQKALYGLVGVVLGLLMMASQPGQGLLWGIVFTVFGYFVPDILVVNDSQKREQSMDKNLPDAIDMLTLCVESGLSFEAAAARVSTGLDGPVSEELGALLGEMRLGKSRNEVLGALVERTKSPGIRQFGTALLQVDRMGVPVAAVLAEQARDMRQKRKDQARESAQKVTVKILMPLMLCFLPAVFVVVIGPAVVGMMSGLQTI